MSDETYLPAPPAVAPVFDPVPRLARELAIIRRASPPSSRCSTRATPSRSSRATARRRPAASTRCRSARSRSSARTWSSSRSGARAILAAIAEQGKLTPELEAELARVRHARRSSRTSTCPTSPSAARRAHRSPASAGLEPLAERILGAAADGDPAAEAAAFVDATKEVPDVDAALAGARDIVAETHRRARRGARVRARGVRRARRARRRRSCPARTRRADQVRAVLRLRASGRRPSRRTASSRSAAARPRACCARTIDVDARRVDAGIARLRRASTRASPWAGAARAGRRRRAQAPARARRVENDVRVELKSAPTRGGRRLRREPAQAAARRAARRRGGARHRSRACAPAASAPSSTTTGKLLEHDTIYLVQGDAQLDAARKDDCSRSCRSTRRARSPSATAPHGRETEASCARCSREAGLDGRVVRRAGQRGRRERLLGERRGARRVPRARPHGARRDLDRAPPAGSARRAGEDRSQGDRRRPVPARRLPAAARARSSTRSSRAA